MKLIDPLVQELPKRGGWPDCAESVVQDADDSEFYFFTGGPVKNGGKSWWFVDSDSRNDNSKWIFFEGKNDIADDCNSAIVTRAQYESALAASQKPTWNGEGLPPAGCRVEYTCKNPDIGHPSIEPGRWYGGVIIAYYNECVWTSDNGVRHLSNTIFRPMRSKSDQKRYDAIESLFEILDAGVSASQDSIDIYDAIAAGKIPGVKLDD